MAALDETRHASFVIQFIHPILTEETHRVLKIRFST